MVAPPLVWMSGFLAVMFFFALILVLGVYNYTARKKIYLHGKHVVITGGSSGIGKSLACEAARRGANVTIVARNQSKLNEASKEITEAVCASDQKIQTVSLDVTTNYEEIKTKLLATEDKSGPVFMLINCAGTSLCGVLDDVSESNIKNLFAVNAMGSILPTKALVPGMKQRKSGHIVLVASQAAYIGIYGFSVYSATKFALRGFAEALKMELNPYDVKVMVSYPPDTDTPGFQEEEKTKPIETKLISETSGLYQPDRVANKILDDSLMGKFSNNIGLDGFLLENICCGVTPMDNIFDFLIQVCFLGILRCIAIGYNLYFQRIVNKCYSIKNKQD